MSLSTWGQPFKATSRAQVAKKKNKQVGEDGDEYQEHETIPSRVTGHVDNMVIRPAMMHTLKIILKGSSREFKTLLTLLPS